MNGSLLEQGMFNFIFLIITLCCHRNIYCSKDDNSEDGVFNQLKEYRNSIKNPKTITTGFGAPVDSLTTSLTVGKEGPMVMYDTVFMEHQSKFNRERIPERSAHAKGAGAFGYFKVTKDITRYTKASMFSKIRKRTNIAVRFSQTSSERGQSDTVRGIRGFAIKFYTDEGIFDLVGNNMPMFIIRDPMLTSSVFHAFRKNPVTNTYDLNMLWDFVSLRPEAMNHILYIFSDRGIPNGYRHMDGHGVNTYKFVNATGHEFWCKFHYKTNQGIKNLTAEEATDLRGRDPDYMVRDLYNAIYRGDFPSWTFYVQVMTLEEAKDFKYNIFDPTKIWPEADVPLIEVGTIMLNKNPENYFEDVEQLALNPGNLVPGIEPSLDRLFHGRVFAYGDAQRYRLGPNHLQLRVNCPFQVQNYQRDGPQNHYNQKGAPNYFPNSYLGPEEFPQARLIPNNASGYIDRYGNGEDDNYSQPGEFYQNELDNGGKKRLVDNIALSLGQTYDFIQERALKHFILIDANFGKKIAEALGMSKSV